MKGDEEDEEEEEERENGREGWTGCWQARTGEQRIKYREMK